MKATLLDIEELVGIIHGFCRKHDLYYSHGGNTVEYWFKIEKLNRKLVERCCVRWFESDSVSEAAAYIMADMTEKFRLNDKKETVNNPKTCTDIVKEYFDNKTTFEKYCYNDLVSTLKYVALTPKSLPEIKKVIFNNPATIVFWSDNTKTVVKADPEYDIYDPEKGLALAISKKVLGNNYSYYNTFKHWLKKYEADEPHIVWSASTFSLENTVDKAIEDIRKSIEDSAKSMSRMQKAMVSKE